MSGASEGRTASGSRRFEAVGRPSERPPALGLARLERPLAASAFPPGTRSCESVVRGLGPRTWTPVPLGRRGAPPGCAVPVGVLRRPLAPLGDGQHPAVGWQRAEEDVEPALPEREASGPNAGRRALEKLSSRRAGVGPWRVARRGALRGWVPRRQIGRQMRSPRWTVDEPAASVRAPLLRIARPAGGETGGAGPDGRERDVALKMRTGHSTERTHLWVVGKSMKLNRSSSGAVRQILRNKFPLPQSAHVEVSKWWYALQRALEDQGQHES